MKISKQTTLIHSRKYIFRNEVNCPFWTVVEAFTTRDQPVRLVVSERRRNQQEQDFPRVEP
jgi:hypothetical protein